MKWTRIITCTGAVIISIIFAIKGDYDKSLIPIMAIISFTLGERNVKKGK